MRSRLPDGLPQVPRLRVLNHHEGVISMSKTYEIEKLTVDPVTNKRNWESWDYYDSKGAAIKALSDPEHYGDGNGGCAGFRLVEVIRRHVPKKEW